MKKAGYLGIRALLILCLLLSIALILFCFGCKVTDRNKSVGHLKLAEFDSLRSVSVFNKLTGKITQTEIKFRIDTVTKYIQGKKIMVYVKVPYDSIRTVYVYKDTGSTKVINRVSSKKVDSLFKNMAVKKDSTIGRNIPWYVWLIVVFVWILALYWYVIRPNIKKKDPVKINQLEANIPIPTLPKLKL